MPTRPPTRVFWFWRPNVWTTGRFAVALLVLVLPLFGLDELAQAGLLAFSLVFALVSDYLDGFLSRRQSMVTQFGKIWDPAADCAYFVALFFTFAALSLVPLSLVLLVLLRETVQNLGLRPYMMSARHISVAAHWTGKTKMVLQCALSGVILLGLLDFDSGLTLIIADRAVLNTVAVVSFSVIVAASWLSTIPYWRGVLGR